MFSHDEARKRIFEHINSVCRVHDDQLQIYDRLTVERPYGWIFMFDCQKFIETGDPTHAQVVGNVPLAFDRISGEIVEIRWEGSLEKSIVEYEKSFRAEDIKGDHSST